MDAEKIVREYTEQGYDRVIIKQDEPQFRYESHYHPREVVLHVVEGALDVQFDQKTHRVNPGQHIKIDADRYHVTCMSNKGCRYVHAEREPGGA